jgi:FkbM family methyltransferase
VKAELNTESLASCKFFTEDKSRPKFIMGINVYAQALISSYDISGFIDEESSKKSHLSLPILRIDDLPHNALVLIASGGRPLTAKRRLDEKNISSIDYFSLVRYAPEKLTPIVFNENAEICYEENKNSFQHILNLIQEPFSREIYQRLVNFRVTHNLKYLEGFTTRVLEQYFEDFLNIGDGENQIFCDIGAFDGFTTAEFIRRYPRFKEIHIFEPDPANYTLCKTKFCAESRIQVHGYALSNCMGSIRFDSSGSTSRSSSDGSVRVPTAPLDSFYLKNVTFLKIDIEGGERLAIQGAKLLIKQCHPIIAVSIYHSFEDFYKIPELVLSIRQDYSIYIRHYTESIYETVCFFIPN